MLSWHGWLACCGWFTYNIGYPSAASRVQDREKFAGQRPTFYHCATQPTNPQNDEHDILKVERDMSQLTTFKLRQCAICPTKRERGATADNLE